MQQSQDQLHQHATVPLRNLTTVQQASDGILYHAQGLSLHQQDLQSLRAKDAALYQQQQGQPYAPQQPSLEQLRAQLPPHTLNYERPNLSPQAFPSHTYQQIQQVEHTHPHTHVTGSSFALAHTPLPGPTHHVHASIHTTPRIARRPLQIQQQPVQQPPHQYSLPLLGSSSNDLSFGNHSQFKGLKLIPNPPHLDEWRQQLFDVDETITLTEEQFQIYFPHIDNIYSHRSTQRHKRKSFVSHYWDCRLKGRPPGTKKSTDPEKKKRKRVARERDLCDVKIKITEFFNQKEYEEQMGYAPSVIEEDDHLSFSSNQTRVVDAPLDQSMFLSQPQMLPQQPMQPSWNMPLNVVQPGISIFAPAPSSSPSPPSKRFYTFQRVNGSGGNGKGNGVAGPHKHTLEESDRVKKNMVMRTLAKNKKETKRVQVSLTLFRFYVYLGWILYQSCPFV